MADQPPPVPPPQPVQPVLAYRAVRFVWRIGTAPRLIDFLMILATAICLFIAAWMILLALFFEAPKLLLLIAPALIALVFGLWYWSNHFHHRQPLAIEEMTDAERQQVAPGNR